MSSAPTTDVTTGDRPDPPGRAAPKVRTYLLPAILTVPLFFPTAIPAIVHATKARGHVPRRRHPSSEGASRRCPSVGVDDRRHRAHGLVLHPRRAQHLSERRCTAEGLLQLGRDLRQLGQHPQRVLAEHQAVHDRGSACAHLGPVRRDPARSSRTRRRADPLPRRSRTSTCSTRCPPSSSSTSLPSECR